MYKRKNRAVSLCLDKDDIVFEDDSEPELENINSKKKLGQLGSQMSLDLGSGSRVSSRTKKPKLFYDPSESMPKKKRESMPQAIFEANLKKQHQMKVAAAASALALSSPMKPKVIPKTPVKQLLRVKTPTKQEVKPIGSQTVQITKSSTPLRSNLIFDANKYKLAPPQIMKVVKPIHQVAAATISSTGPNFAAISPSQSKRKTLQIPIKDPDAKSLKSARNQSSGTLRYSEFNKASTVEPNERLTKTPDVGKWKWSALEVYQYFLQQGFEEKDARIFKDQEIDGESLLIMCREDLGNLNLRVGVFVKMWKRIVQFQSGSKDISQGWK